jgi:hypothetical protein
MPHVVVKGKTDRLKDTGSDLHFQRGCEALHDSGPRPLGELLAECVAEFGDEFGDFLRRRLNRYTAIPPDVYHALGGDRFPAPPIHEVQNE